jgi:saccharopine dehydrogenase-like NADP-dependent oxidoreductase
MIITHSLHLHLRIFLPRRGVLTAGTNDAKYLIEGRVVNVDGKNLFKSARDITLAGPSMALEHIPNRDSLPYQAAYKIPEATSIYRGTLRYKGFCEIMGAFASLGLFNMDVPPQSFDTWGQCMKVII